MSCAVIRTSLALRAPRLTLQTGSWLVSGDAARLTSCHNVELQPAKDHVASFSAAAGLTDCLNVEVQHA